MLLCIKCRGNNIGETENLRERTSRSKSHIRNNKSALIPCAKNLCGCINLTEPDFYCYTFYYENETMFRQFKEWRFKCSMPLLNSKFWTFLYDEITYRLRLIS